MSNKSKHINRQCTQQCNNRNQCQTSTRKFNAKNKDIRNTYQRAAKIAPRRPKSTQEQPKTPSRRPKSHPKTVQRGPKSPQEPPRAAQDPSQDDPRPPQERSWNGLGAILGPSNNKIEVKIDFCQTSPPTLARFWSPKRRPNRPQIDPKTS